MFRLNDPLSLKNKQIRDFLSSRFEISDMSKAQTFSDMNESLSQHSDIIVVLNHDAYNVIVVEVRDSKDTHVTIERIGIIFTAPFIHPTSQYNYVNMLDCDEIVFNNTFFELSTEQLMDCCSLNQPVDESDYLF